MDRLDAARTSIVIVSERERTGGSRQEALAHRWLILGVCGVCLLVLLGVLVPALRLNADVAALRQAIDTHGDTSEIVAAVTSLERSSRVNAESPYLYRWLARGYLALGRVDEAKQAIERAYMLDPQSLLVEYDMALILEETDNIDTAYALRDRSQLDANVVRYAEAARSYGRYDEALFWYERAQTSGWELTGAIAYTRFELARAQGDPDAAPRYLADVVALDRGWTSDRQRLDAMRFYGMWLVEQRRHTEATALLGSLSAPTLADLPPAEQAETQRYLGLALWGDNQLAPALAAMERAVALDPQNVWTQLHYAKVLYVNDPARLPEVRTAFATALGLSKHNHSFYHNIIEFWQWQRQPEEAKLLCEAAAAHDAAAELASLCP